MNKVHLIPKMRKILQKPQMQLVFDGGFEGSSCRKFTKFFRFFIFTVKDRFTTMNKEKANRQGSSEGQGMSAIGKIAGSANIQNVATIRNVAFVAVEKSRFLSHLQHSS